jgi:hypothetical protein
VADFPDPGPAIKPYSIFGLPGILSMPDGNLRRLLSWRGGTQARYLASGITAEIFLFATFAFCARFLGLKSTWLAGDQSQAIDGRRSMAGDRWQVEHNPMPARWS